MTICPNCNANILAKVDICPVCGSDIDEDEE